MEAQKIKLRVYKTERVFNIEHESYSLLFDIIEGDTMTTHGVVKWIYVDRGIHVDPILLVLCPVCYEAEPQECRGE
jgi:hypothetical protein